MAKRMSKQMRKKRTVRVILICVMILAMLTAVLGTLRKQVTSRVNAGNQKEVQTATVSRGSIRNVVSGSGNLSDEDVEELALHSGVEIDEIVVEAGDAVKEGDLLATVNMSTVLSAMADVQGELNDLDDEIGKASDDELDSTIKSTLSGRVMKLYATKGDDVSTVMYENGALALLSLDGYQAVDVETEALTVGDAVTVTGSDGTTFEGNVESIQDGTAVILVSDEHTLYGDTVLVTDANGADLGSGELYIHQELKITGIAGTIKGVSVSENQKISANTTLFTLTDTSFSANYTSLLEERADLEEQLQELVRVYQDGAVLAPLSGTVSSVDWDDSGAASGGINAEASDTNTTETDGEKTLLTICPGVNMTVAVNVDETDILSLEVGQTATVSVDALDDETVEGTVTEINTTGTSSGGVTVYEVTVAFEKSEKMLSGMSATVSIVIEGVEDALLIPSDALTQTSATSFVHTTYDAETGELGGMVEVTTGLNNGTYVEITGGLSENDMVYYFEEQEQWFGFGNMGGRPGGMSGMAYAMPSGDFDRSNIPVGNFGDHGQ